MSEDKVFLDVGDGPDGIRIFSNEERAIVDSGGALVNGVYVQVSTMGSQSTFGPMLPSIIKQLHNAPALSRVRAKIAELREKYGQFSIGTAIGVKEACDAIERAMEGE